MASAEGLRPVAMQQAFRWECLECATENFDRARPVAFDDPAEEFEAKDSLGIPLDVEGEIVSIPETVTCRQCLAMFSTEH